MSDEPLVSVCIPAHQAERHIAHTLRSALAQTYPNLEVLVLDNACTDGTPQVLAECVDPRLRVVRNSSVLPIAENWNRLVALASGELIKVLCADDLLHPNIVSRQVEVFESYPTLALVSCRRHLITEDSVVVATSRGLSGLTGWRSGRAAVRRVVRHGGNPIGESACVLFRAEHFRRTEGFDASLLFPMDIDLWVRLLRHGDFYGVPQALAAFRAGSSSISSALSASQYAEQRTLADRIGSDPFWRLGVGSKVLGRAGTFKARNQHRALFLASAWRNRHARASDRARESEWLS